MTRPGFHFSTRFKVRYAEIDGQKIVFNSRYLEYADYAVGEFWEWTGIGALGPVWTSAEFNVRHTEIDYLKPFRYGDEIEVFVRIERLGNSSMTHRFELCDPNAGSLNCVIEMVTVHVDLDSGRPVPIPPAVRAALEGLMTGARIDA
ncbi:thioesterase family protein [Sphingomonas sp.]|uniref:acyl-CoA thioesterase n=1 Tax=Sphingomonas sp. TaxID=28214 RepID=UPI001DC31131|nr:thioesterase family protein [Sphingomonas sp.]MBX9795860.1 acyl-CoA thioesterase [Sphingomonas sp.]